MLQLTFYKRKFTIITVKFVEVVERFVVRFTNILSCDVDHVGID